MNIPLDLQTAFRYHLRTLDQPLEYQKGQSATIFPNLSNCIARSKLFIAIGAPTT